MSTAIGTDIASEAKCPWSLPENSFRTFRHRFSRISRLANGVPSCDYGRLSQDDRRHDNEDRPTRWYLRDDASHPIVAEPCDQIENSRLERHHRDAR